MGNNTVTGMMNSRVLQEMKTNSTLTKVTSLGSISASSFSTGQIRSVSISDSFSSSRSVSILQMTVERMRSLLSPSTSNNDNIQLFRQANPQLATSISQTNASLSLKVEMLEGSLTESQQSQLDKNMAQAAQVTKQLGVNGAAWGVDSLAQDLAVFGFDLTAMNQNPSDLAQLIRDKSLELLADLDKNFAGNASEADAARRRITGASSRLVHGLSGAGGATAVAAGSVSSRVNVTIDGVSVNASAIIAVGNVIVDPLVLDLNGDGIDLKGHEEGVDFDMNGNGEKTNMGFIRGDDAFLFVDEYGDGMVRDGRQLFGNSDGYANGFEKLAAYDDNGDGVIDENDAIWEKLRVWVEKTEDGVCDADETMSLSEAGITSINVGYQNVREDDGKGNLIGQVGSFTRSDGSSGLAADVWLQEGTKKEAAQAPQDSKPAAPAQQNQPQPNPMDQARALLNELNLEKYLANWP